MLLRNLISILSPLLLGIMASVVMNRYNFFPSEHFTWSLAFFTLIALLANFVYSWLARSETFTQVILGGIVVRLLSSFLFVFLYALYLEEQFSGFSAHFLIHYVLFTVAEIVFLFYIIKYHSQHAV